MLRAVQAGHVPVVGAYESLITLTWVVVIVYLVLEWRTQIKAIGLYVMPAVLRAARRRLDPVRGAGPPRAGAASSDIVVIHVIVIFTAVAAFVRGRRRGRPLPVSRSASSSATGPAPCSAACPACARSTGSSDHAIMFGLPFLSMGIVAGVIRAEKFKVADWWSDPLVLMAIAAWVVYVVYVYTRLASGWRGRRAACAGHHRPRVAGR